MGFLSLFQSAGDRGPSVLQAIPVYSFPARRLKH